MLELNLSTLFGEIPGAVETGYFTGRAPTADEFQMHWSQMDLLRVGRVSKSQLAKWLKKGAPEA